MFWESVLLYHLIWLLICHFMTFLDLRRDNEWALSSLKQRVIFHTPLTGGLVCGTRWLQATSIQQEAGGQERRTRFFHGWCTRNSTHTFATITLLYKNKRAVKSKAIPNTHTHTPKHFNFYLLKLSYAALLAWLYAFVFGRKRPVELDYFNSTNNWKSVKRHSWVPLNRPVGNKPQVSRNVLMTQSFILSIRPRTNPSLRH